jgi:lipopolysaccharide biosynthesis glycosyltransferase
VQEFKLLDYSLSQYHDVEWFLSTDEYSANALGSSYNCSVLIRGEEGSHGSPNPEENSKFHETIMTKFDACEAALQKYDSVLFLDSDIFFLNGIDSDVLSLMKNDLIDAILCPHHTENKSNEANVGYYNVGFFVIRNRKLLQEWKDMSTRHKELGMYYEQQPLEYSSKTYTTLSLPINYNIGWWRMNENHTKYRLKSFDISNNTIHFLGQPAICIHAHTFKRLDYGNQATEMLLMISQLLKANVGNKKNQDLLNYMLASCRSYS